MTAMFRFFLTLFAAAWLFYPAHALGAESDGAVDVVQVDNGGGSIPAATVGVIIAAVLGGLGFTAGRKSAVKIEPTPLEVRDANAHFVTEAKHDADIKRLYDLYYSNTEKLNQLIGLVQGIRDTIQNIKQK